MYTNSLPLFPSLPPRQEPVVPSDAGDSGFYYYYYPVEEGGKKKGALDYKDGYHKDKCAGEKVGGGRGALLFVCLFMCLCVCLCF